MEITLSTHELEDYFLKIKTETVEQKQQDYHLPKHRALHWYASHLALHGAVHKKLFLDYLGNTLEAMYDHTNLHLLSGEKDLKIKHSPETSSF